MVANLVTVAPASCAIWDAGCMANSAFESFVQALGEGAVKSLKLIGTFWFSIPSPEVAVNAGGNAWGPDLTIARLQANLRWYVFAVAVLGFIVGAIRLVWTSRVAPARDIVRMLFTLLASTAAVGAVVQLLITAGDAFAPWVIQQATGAASASAGMNQIVGMLAVTNSSGLVGLWFVLFLLLLLGAVAQVIFMIFRGAAIMTLMVFVPLFAADTVSEEGWQRYRKTLGLLLAFVLYKPVAAVIFALGFSLVADAPTGGDSQLMKAMYGFTVIILASLALPALIKFLVPLAAAGSSNAFSGGAAVGAVAAGAAIVGTGGAAAGAAATRAGGGAIGSAAASAAPGGGGAPAPPSNGAGSPPGGGFSGAGPSGGASAAAGSSSGSSTSSPSGGGGPGVTSAEGPQPNSSGGAGGGSPAGGASDAAPAGSAGANRSRGDAGIAVAQGMSQTARGAGEALLDGSQERNEEGP